LDLHHGLVALRQGAQIAGEALDQNDPNFVLVDGLLNDLREFAGRNFGGVEVPDLEMAGCMIRPQIHPKALRASEERLQPLLEEEHGDALAPLEGGVRVDRGESRFAGAGLADDERGRAALARLGTTRG